MQPALPSGSDVAEAVLGATGRARAIRLRFTFLAAFALHAAALWGVRHRMLSFQAAPSATAPTMKEDEFDLTPQPPVPPTLVPESTSRAHRAALAEAPATAVHAERLSRREAAQAATVVAPTPDRNKPIDLTAEAVVTGTATAYAGGATASTGTSTSAVGQAPAAPSSREPTASVAFDRSSPVSLGTESWSCPWPREAGAENIEEQTVILRVIVTASGDPESARVLSDPGHGFGPAALVCAMRTHFTPARDPKGNRIRATSPPIRVRFSR